MSFTHHEVGPRTCIVEYKPDVFGLPLVVVGVVDRRRDAEPPIRPILDEQWTGVRVTRGIVDDVLVRTCYYDRGCRRSNSMCEWVL